MKSKLSVLSSPLLSLLPPPSLSLSFLSLYTFFLSKWFSPPPENKILVKQSPMLVVNDNEVNLSCKYTYNLFSKEFRASLYKGADSAVEVCAVNGNHSHPLQSTNKEFNCTVKVGNETVTFYLQDLYVNQTDIYFCKLEVLYPPPYIDNEKSNGTIIHVKGNVPLSQCLLSSNGFQLQSWKLGHDQWWGLANSQRGKPERRSTHVKLVIFCMFCFISHSVRGRRKEMYSNAIPISFNLLYSIFQRNIFVHLPGLLSLLSHFGPWWW